MLELARILLFFRVISWQIGWLGIRVGEAAVPGPAAMKQVHQVLELTGIRLCGLMVSWLSVRIVSWQIRWLGTRVGESAVPGPGGTMRAHQELELTGIRVCALIVSRQIGLLETRVGEAAAPGLDGGGDGVLTTINSRKQRMKAVDRVAGKIPVKQNGESEHFRHFDEAWRQSASTFPFFSRGSHDTGEPHRAQRACICGGNVSDGGTAVSVANSDQRNGKTGKCQWTRHVECHLRNTCPSVTGLPYLVSDESTPGIWSLGCLCVCSLLRLLYSIFSVWCCMKISHWNTAANLTRGAPIQM